MQRHKVFIVLAIIIAIILLLMLIITPHKIIEIKTLKRIIFDPNADFQFTYEFSKPIPKSIREKKMVAHLHNIVVHSTDANSAETNRLVKAFARNGHGGPLPAFIPIFIDDKTIATNTPPIRHSGDTPFEIQCSGEVHFVAARD